MESGELKKTENSLEKSYATNLVGSNFMLCNINMQGDLSYVANDFRKLSEPHYIKSNASYSKISRWKFEV